MSCDTAEMDLFIGMCSTAVVTERKYNNRYDVMMEYVQNDAR